MLCVKMTIITFKSVKWILKFLFLAEIYASKIPCGVSFFLAHLLSSTDSQSLLCFMILHTACVANIIASARLNHLIKQDSCMALHPVLLGIRAFGLAVIG